MHQPSKHGASGSEELSGPGWRLRAAAAGASLAICGLFGQVLSATYIGMNQAADAPRRRFISLSLLSDRSPVLNREREVRAPRAVPVRPGGGKKAAQIAMPPNLPSQGTLPPVLAPAGEDASPAPIAVPAPLRVDVSAAMSGERAKFREMAASAGVTLQHGVMTQDDRLALAVARTEKRDCLGPRKDLRADLIQLAIYLHTVASGKCKGQ